MNIRIVIPITDADDLATALAALEESDLGGGTLDGIRIEYVR